MVVDTSAMVAILTRPLGHDWLSDPGYPILCIGNNFSGTELPVLQPPSP